jgi:predicted DNA-binding transcriptional regulator YafY
MRETSGRLLRLLALLQTRTDWTGPQLAERLQVTTRTVRKDVERLRDLGYPVHAQPGVAGGYRLGAGTSLPPLLLEDDEAVAVAVGMRLAASGALAGAEEASVRALAKLEQVLPSRLRHRVAALHGATLALPGAGAAADPEVLSAIAATVRARERLRFDYETHGGAKGLRTVEPQRLVHTRGRWYLVAFDPGRDDWRTFRVDRIQPRTPTGPRFVPRDPPDVDIATYISRGVWSAGWRHQAQVRLHAPAEAVAQRLPPGVGLVEAVDQDSCLLRTGAETLETLAVYLGMLGVDFEVSEPPELVDHLRTLADRYHRATP